FSLGVNDTAVIPLEQITEVVQIPLTEICGVPQMPNCVVGIYNWRGEMLWLVDLEEMLGYPPLLQGSNLLSKIMALVLEHEGKYLGILIRQLIDIDGLDTQEMKQASGKVFYPEMTPFLQGYFINDSEQMIFNLNASAMLQNSMWTTHN
ncbi:chemotaxis protein CheW, partial [Dolichospermum sp. ST_sed7]|nr:chemotaxis protein CheW [Dolichospermum sp. ST_sed7]